MTDPYTVEEAGPSMSFGTGPLAATAASQGASAMNYTHGAVHTFLSQPEPNPLASSMVPAAVFRSHASQAGGPPVTTNIAVRGSDAFTVSQELRLAHEYDKYLAESGPLTTDGDVDMAGIGDWSIEDLLRSPVQSTFDGTPNDNPTTIVTTATAIIVPHLDGVSSNNFGSHTKQRRVKRGHRGGRGSRGGRGGVRGGHTDQMTRGADSREFACPFFKHDPVKNGPICGHRKWAADDVHRIKEHIKECHSEPLYQCSRCYQDLETTHALFLHEQQAIACIPCVPTGGINAKQALLLKSRKGGWGKSPEEKWLWIYQTVFPHDKVIPDPYHNSPTHSRIRNEFSLLHDYRVRQNRNLVSMFKSSSRGRTDDIDWDKLQELFNQDYCDFLREVHNQANQPKQEEPQHVSNGPAATPTHAETSRPPSHVSELFPGADLGSRDGMQGEGAFTWGPK